MKKMLLTSLMILCSIAQIQADRIIVGTKGFTEQFILGEITKQYLESHGEDVQMVTGLNTATIRPYLEQGYLDLYWEYTGTAMLFHRVKDFEQVKKKDEQKGLLWGESAKFSNGWTLISKNPQYKKISDISGKSWRIAMNESFKTRKDGYPGLAKAYQLKDNILMDMERFSIFDAVERGEADFGVVFGTDIQTDEYGFTPLEDDKHYFSTYYPTPVFREKLSANLEKLNNISKLLDRKTIVNMIIDVERNKKTKVEVAQTWLTSVKDKL